MDAQDHVRALSQFKEASFIDPTWVLPYIQQGYIHIEMGNFTDAEQAARRAISIDASQQSAHLVLGIALHNQGLHREALTSVETALQMNLDDRVAQFYQARILMDLGESDRAFSILNRLLETANQPEEISRMKAELEAWHRYLQSTPTGVP
jgi:tetratricopeptide (TPR) repeat protein